MLHNFENDNGNSPAAGLTWDAAGNLYGMTEVSRVSAGNGLVFKLTPNQDGSWTETILYRFKDGRDGAFPDLGNLIFDAAGNFTARPQEAAKGAVTGSTVPAAAPSSS